MPVETIGMSIFLNHVSIVNDINSVDLNSFTKLTQSSQCVQCLHEMFFTAEKCYLGGGGEVKPDYHGSESIMFNLLRKPGRGLQDHCVVTL